MTSSRTHHPVTWLRRTALVEGVSFLLLLFVAMPLKYAAGYPEATKVAGWIHGVLFMAFLFAWVIAWPKLPVKWIVLSFVGAVIPFGPFLVDRHLKPFETSPSQAPVPK